MLSVYPACFIKEENGYSVIFPDFGYLSTCGPTLDNAVLRAIDCLAGQIYWMQKNGEPVPEPSAQERVDPMAVLADLADDGEDISRYETFVNLVTVDVEEYAQRHFERSVKKTLTIPAWLNEAAMKQKINFSHVLQDALKERLDIQ